MKSSTITDSVRFIGDCTSDSYKFYDFDGKEVSTHTTVSIDGYLNDYDTYEDFRKSCIDAFSWRYKHVTRI